MEESRLKQLRGLRNNEIKRLASDKGLSVSSLSYLFNLSESQIRQIASAYLVSPENVIRHSIEDLDNWRNNRKKYYSSQNLSPEEIDYIFHKGRLVQSEEIQSLKCQVSQLLSEKSDLKLKLDSLNIALQSNKLAVEEKDKKINSLTELLSKYKSYMEGMKCLESSKKELESELKVSGEKIKDLESSLGASNKKIKDLESLLGASNKKIKELSSTLESRSLSLTNMSADLDTKRAEILSLRDSKNQLESALRASDDKINIYIKKIDDKDEELLSMKNVACTKDEKVQELESRVKELESNLQSYNGISLSYQIELESLKLEKTLLEEENKSLKSSIATLSEPEEPKDKKDTKFKKVYTDEERKQMVSIYKECNCKRKIAWQTAQAQLGLRISESQFINIMKEANVFRKSYKRKH